MNTKYRQGENPGSVPIDPYVVKHDVMTDQSEQTYQDDVIVSQSGRFTVALPAKIANGNILRAPAKYLLPNNN